MEQSPEGSGMPPLTMAAPQSSESTVSGQAQRIEAIDSKLHTALARVLYTRQGVTRGVAGSGATFDTVVVSTAKDSCWDA
jgi:hypothetical protein